MAVTSGYFDVRLPRGNLGCMPSYNLVMSRQPPVPKGWRFPIKASETESFFPGVGEVLWFPQPSVAYPGYEPPTVTLDRRRPTSANYEDEALGFRATVAVVPVSDLGDARQWLMDEVQSEIADWLDVQRRFPPTRGKSTYARWCWPSKHRTIVIDE